jgi:hypothetical protein
MARNGTRRDRAADSSRVVPNSAGIYQEILYLLETYDAF